MNTRELTHRYRLSHWAEVLKEQSRSGLNVKDFCAEKGLAKHQYFYWQNKLRSATAAQALGQLKSGDELPMQKFAEVSVSASNQYDSEKSAGTLRIELGSIRITVDSNYPVGSLAGLLSTLVTSC